MDNALKWAISLVILMKVKIENYGQIGKTQKLYVESSINSNER